MPKSAVSRQAVAHDTAPQLEEAEWRLACRDDVGLIRARYVRQSFPRHTHEAFVIGVNERGAHRSWYAGEVVVIPELTIVVVPPGEVHTGEPLPCTPWDYRAIYPPTDMLCGVADELGASSSELPVFSGLVLTDREVAHAFLDMHRKCERADVDPLAAEESLIRVLMNLIARHGGGRRVRSRKAPARPVARALEYMRAHYARPVSLDSLAGVTGLSRFATFRAFRRDIGISPYAFLTQIRVEEARRLMASGVSIAQASHRAGFCDQSHLHRHFKRLVGVTPGAFARGVRR